MRINSHGALCLSFIMIYNMMLVRSQTIITCDDTTDCSNEVITCEEGSDCTITCMGTEDRKNCQCATFICPSGPYDCNFSCLQGQPEQCVGVIVDASQTNFGNLMIDISGLRMTQKARFISPTNGDTTINAGGNGVLGGGTVVDASHTISGNVDIKYNDNIADWKYAGMEVYCPMSGHCIIDSGVGYGACAACKIYSQPTTSLVSVTAVGTIAFKGADIFCPPKSGSEKTCKITTTGYYGNAFEDMDIFAAESFTNVELSASYSSIGVPIMHCMAGYDESCTVEKVSDGVWQCEDTTSLCHDWTYDPAYVAPTEPSTTVGFEITTTDARCMRDPTTTDPTTTDQTTTDGSDYKESTTVAGSNDKDPTIADGSSDIDPITTDGESTTAYGSDYYFLGFKTNDRDLIITAVLVFCVVAAVICCCKRNNAGFQSKKQTPVPVATADPTASVEMYPVTQPVPAAAALPAPNVRVVVVPASVNTGAPGEVYPTLQPGGINRISLPSSATAYQAVGQNSPVTPVTGESQNSPVTPASQQLPVTPC